MPARRHHHGAGKPGTVSKVLPLGKTRLLTGNEAAAYAVLLCQPNVICAYPITPQTEALETLARFRAEGALKSQMVEVEGEHSAISVLMGASGAGARTFTATSSQGLFFMYEAYHRAAQLRLPIVMAIVTREMDNTVAASQQDAIEVRDGGWIQIHTGSCQEILDTIVMAYRLAEDPEIQLPVSVCYDGYYLSHLSERVDIPLMSAVQEFLPRSPRTHLTFDPSSLVRLGRQTTGEIFTEQRYKHCAAMERAKKKFEEIDQQFSATFGRGYGGAVEEYRINDADIALIAMGSCAETAKKVVDLKRNEGVKVGVIKVRQFRPFPRERLREALKNIKAIGVIDRNVCFGWNSGVFVVELRSALYGLNSAPVLGFVDGIGGTDITRSHLARAIDILKGVSLGTDHQEITWLTLE